MKILGLDYGDTSIGVAVYDSSVDFVYPKDTIFRDKDNVVRKSLRAIEEIIKDENIEKIVLGLPITMSDKEGTRAIKTKEFGEILKKRTNMEILYQDERLSTIEASEILDKNNIKASDKKKYIDSVAASIILREYVNTMKGEYNGRKK